LELFPSLLQFIYKVLHSVYIHLPPIYTDVALCPASLQDTILNPCIMKTLTLLMTVVILGSVTPGYSQQTARQDAGKEIQAKTNGPVAEFDKTTFEFGDLIQNSPGTAMFTLTNRGNEPLIISSANASCGCTNLRYSKDPVLPGKSTTLSATYNAAAPGSFLKTVTVRTNAGDQPVVLQIKGKVVPKS
jgi:hypothetical protein